jgi:hypothetical protein
VLTDLETQVLQPEKMPLKIQQEGYQNKTLTWLNIKEK